MKIALLLVSILIFLFSLQILVPVQSYFYWKLTIAATELSNFIIILPIIFLSIYLFKTDYISKTISVISVCSIILYLIPIVNAIIISTNLQKELKSEFGNDFEPNFPAYNLLKSYQYNQSKSKGFETFVYQQTDSTILTMDVYHKKTEKKQPLIICVHGGAWSAGNSSGFETFDDFFADQGFVMAEINYCLAPEFKFPTPIDNVVEAYQFLIKNAEKFNIDTNKVFLLGRSAGGQIATIAASKLTTKLKGIITFYTPHDMVWGYSMPGNPKILDSRKVLEDYLGGSYTEAKESYHLASSPEVVSANFPPILMIHGSRDEMVAYEHNLHLIPVLREFKISHFLLTLPWATHGADYVFFGPTGQLSTYTIRYFLEKQIQNK